MSQLSEGVQRFLGVAFQTFAGGGQSKSSTRALEQRQAERVAKGAQLKTHGGLGGVQLARDLGEAAAARDGEEGLQLMIRDRRPFDHSSPGLSDAPTAHDMQGPIVV